MKSRSFNRVMSAFVWLLLGATGSACNLLPPLAMTEDAVHTQLADDDGDGWRRCPEGTTEDCDCDDSRSDIYPRDGSEETCDGQDNDCDGVNDDGLPMSTYYRDDDGDGFGTDDASLTDCKSYPGFSLLGGDCDDNSPKRYPGNQEICDDLDNNCDEDVDEGLNDIYYLDHDGDSFGTGDASYMGCGPAEGYIKVAGDCNDGDVNVHPGATEICDHKDQDCDEEIDEFVSIPTYEDKDGDGHGDEDSDVEWSCPEEIGRSTLHDDCNDENAGVYPNAEEVCDAYDNDCDGIVDEDINFSYWFPDDDGDGYGTDVGEKYDCKAQAGYVVSGGDCNDTNAAVWPGAPERCGSSIDNNCDGSKGTESDRDGDGYLVCFTDELAADCDDNDITSHPNATELCDGKDNNCDGTIDNADYQLWYLDSDHDTWGTTTIDSNSVVYENECKGTGWATRSGDCNDSAAQGGAAVNPGVAEICNARDDNCDGQVDEGLMSAVFYVDSDGDAYGNEDAPPKEGCSQPRGHSVIGGDCNDSDPGIHPGATESCESALDLNCDGSAGTVDSDADGVQACKDCDDSNDAVHPGANEFCDDLDNDCNGKVDDATDVPFYPDRDGDDHGYPGNPEDPQDVEVVFVDTCVVIGWSRLPDDCNDANPLVYPGAIEQCDGEDNNCNDELAEYELDMDGDGFRGCSSEALPADCDDISDDAKVRFPGNPEVCDGIDNDCDQKVDDGAGTYWYVDTDGDGYGAGTTVGRKCEGGLGEVQASGDCNDSAPSIHPAAWEQCNGVDDDCNEQVDDHVQTLTQYLDYDQDGFGDPHVTSEQSCMEQKGFVPNSDDCNDRAATIHPGAAEICNLVDDNCNAQTDEGVLLTFYVDGDGDGVGAGSSSLQACAPPAGYAPGNTDCDDTNGSISPIAAEACNQQDDNCNRSVDEGLPTETFHPDTDQDGFGAVSVSTQACMAPDGFLADGTDCDDTRQEVYPEAIEQCNRIDDDCNGLPDDAVVNQTWYVDVDGDGYGATALSVENCAHPTGYVSTAGDCDDSDTFVHPGAPEIKDNQVDDNCDGYGDSDWFVVPSGTTPPSGIDPAQVKTTVSAAITAAASGDVIEILAGTYKEQLDFSGKQLLLVGRDGASSTFLESTSGVGPVIIVGTGAGEQGSRIRGVTIQNVLSSSTDTKVNKCGSGVGGAVCVANGASLELRDVILTNNKATSGGGLAVVSASASLHNTQLTNNTATNGGGAYLSQATVTLDETSLVRKNSVSGSGGGLYASSSTVSLNGTQVNTNTGNSEGGAVYATGTSLVATGGRFDSNQVTSGLGGAIRVKSSTIELRDVDFELNVAKNGGAIYSDNSVLSSLVVRGGGFYYNTASSAGGAVYATSGDFSGTAFTGNIASSSYGGALYESGGVIVMTDVRMTENKAPASYGGAAYLAPSGQSTLTGCTLDKNSAAYGGALRVTGPVTLESCVLNYNRATNEGGAIDLTGTGPLSLAHCTVLGNVAGTYGGGINLVPGSGQSPNVAMSNTQVVGNRAVYGGGISARNSAAKATLSFVTLTGNVADYSGGGLYLSSTAGCSIHSTLLGWNVAQTGGNAELDSSTVVQYSAFYSGSTGSSGVSGQSDSTLEGLGNLILKEDPGLLNDPVHGNGTHDDDCHLRRTPESPLVDAGLPSSSYYESDGTRADIGAYGGSDSLATDVDADGLSDDWESAHALDPSTIDADLDPDADGLTNAEELQAATAPELADTDLDGIEDGDELLNATDPLSSFSPGIHAQEPGTAYVPDDYNTLQEAIDEATNGAVIRLRPGTYYERPVLAWKKGLRIESLGTRDDTILDGQEEGRTFLVVDADDLKVQGLTITGGYADYGSGNNGLGGGVYMTDTSDAVFEQFSLTNNYTDRYGGGMYATSSDISIVDGWIVGNLGAVGGGLYLTNGRHRIENTLLSENDSAESDGAAIYASETAGALVLKNSAIVSNKGLSGVYLAAGSMTVSNCRFYSNSQKAVVVENSSVCGASTFTGSLFAFNSAANCNVALYSSCSAYITLTDNIFAFNAPTCSGSLSPNSANGLITSSYNLYYVSGKTTAGTSFTPSSTDIVGNDPKFLDSAHFDFHLSSTSPAINTGDPMLFDPDGSRADMGAYGGINGEDFDLDNDGYYDWFWPGTRNDAPAGYTPSDWDLDDLDPNKH